MDWPEKAGRSGRTRAREEQLTEAQLTEAQVTKGAGDHGRRRRK